MTDINNNHKTTPFKDERLSYGNRGDSFLVLHNDDIHTFDYVIK